MKSEGNLHINSYLFTFNIKIFKIVKRSLGQDNIIMQILYCFEFVHLKKNISLEIDFFFYTYQRFEIGSNCFKPTFSGIMKMC